ncbi:Multidrug resistance-associated protein [Blattamonas nauphoetae]|uniref:Multidrug resistance-associated protein n=1 Tax=Blattamonas nauphoetae TaxID=2049346 RepID=A0ABQ9X2P2_9EUKA|nr:Multidrug resistance-associated protein [Blattamonas nauphoetae]
MSTKSSTLPQYPSENTSPVTQEPQQTNPNPNETEIFQASTQWDESHLVPVSPSIVGPNQTPTPSSYPQEDPHQSTKQDSSEIPRSVNPEESHPFIANLFMCFIFPFLCKCHPLTDRDIPATHKYDRSKPATVIFQQKWTPVFEKFSADVEARGIDKVKKPNVFWVAIKSAGFGPFFAGLVLLLCNIAFTALTPFFSKMFLRVLANKDDPTHTDPVTFPWTAGVMLVLCPALVAFFDVAGNRVIYHHSVRMRAGIVGAVYDKLFKMKNMASLGAADTGRMISLISVDARMIAELTPQAAMLIVTPFQMLAGLILIIVDLGWSVVLSLVTLVVVLAIPLALSSLIRKYSNSYLAFSDTRTRVTNETLQGIRVVKYSGLEHVFRESILKPRNEQVNATKNFVFLIQISASIMRALPILVNFVCFIAFAGFSDASPLTFAVRVMPNAGYLAMVTQPCTMIPIYIQAIVLLGVSSGRLQDFLALPEMKSHSVKRDTPNNEEIAIQIVDGEFKWGDAPDIPLTNEEKLSLQKENKKRKQDLANDRAKMQIEEMTTPQQSPSDTDTQNGKVSNESEVRDEPNAIFRPNASPNINQNANEPNTFISPSPSPNVPTSASPSASSQINQPTLRNINLSIPKGSLTMIVGPVGCGKSSLGAAIVGDIEQNCGTIVQSGRITYCPQTPWIVNNTVRGNITFDAEFDEDKYWNAVRVCALQPDYKIFAAGDQTAIGEKGVNMSGGQKARIQLARAVYSDKDIFILDDPLSAVDAHVGRYLMDECICGALKGKTVILMTNNLQFLDRADKVVVLRDGVIKAQGPYAEIREQGINFDEFLIRSDKSEKTEKTAEAKKEEKQEEQNDDENAKTIMTQEEQETGGIKFSSYVNFLQTLMPAPAVILFLLFVVIGEVVSPFTQWWMARCGTPTDFPSLPFFWKLGIYGLLGVATLFLLMLRSCMVRSAVKRSATKIHNNLLDQVLNCPSSFFDTTPLGRIINRFSGDMPQVDQFLLNTFLQVLTLWIGVIGQIVIVGVDTPVFLAFGIPVLILYLLILLMYSRVSRNLQRLESIARSPVISLFSETISGAGLTTIRSYGREEQWKERFHNVNDFWTTIFQLYRHGLKWATLYSGFISLVLNLGVVIVGWFFMNTSTLSVAIMSAALFSNLGLHLIQQTVELESKMTSFDRIQYYSNNLPQESTTHEVEVPDSWPQRGDVTFENVKFKYRPGLPFVLKGIDLDIEGGESIGVCGRTGAGKSSLLFVLFRLVELDPKLAPKIIDPKTGFLTDPDPDDEPNSGRILIDGVDISKIDIHRMRRAVAIIPQDPTLFTGSLRYNLDLAGKCSDDRIWEVLDMVQMREVVSEMEYGLDTPVAEGGSNFSAGQRQLLCFGRAILNNSRVVVMDEATANVDVETDAGIQRTIREQLKEQTVIVIAHRLNTIMDSSRIVVMDKGEVAEFDTPDNLKANPQSAFNSLIHSLST